MTMILNIYLTTTDINALKKIMQKYLVSLSTIADKVIFEFLKAVNHTKDDDKKPENFEKLKNGYLYTIYENTRTSIKPRIYKELPKLDKRLATNCLKMYARNSWNLIFKNKSDVDRMLSAIDYDLKEVYDQFYNYNEQLRNSIRVIKENKDYIERLQNNVNRNK